MTSLGEEGKEYSKLVTKIDNGWSLVSAKSDFTTQKIS